MRRDPVFAVLGLLVVVVGIVLVALAWPDALTPSCSDPPAIAPGESLIDGYDCTDDPLGAAITAFLPVAAATLSATIGLALFAYGLRKHPGR